MRQAPASHPPEWFLESPRLYWRHWRQDDLPLARALWGDARVTALIVARGALDGTQVRERLEREIMVRHEYGVQYWPLFLRDGNRFAGACGLRPYPRQPAFLEIGVHLLPDVWGHGLATEACRAVIDHAFNVLNVPGLFAGHNPHNVASRALLEKLGFTWIRDELYEPTGLLHPSYTMTAEAFHRLPSATARGFNPHRVAWRDPVRLLAGTPRQRDAALTLREAAILEKLSRRDAVLCGTVPIDCDIAGSDLDIVCRAPDLDDFAAELAALFAGESGLLIKRKHLIGIPTVICRFTRGAWPVEIVGQPMPVADQRAYGHMLAEAMLLAVSPLGTNERIRALRREGLSTEAAFGRHFHLPGDPYLALLDIYRALPVV
jgi:RimJ/RimL family protein N-acetyltransferase